MLRASVERLRGCAAVAGVAAMCWLAVLAVPAAAREEATPRYEYGEPEVMRFRDGRVGAFTMQFDDSMISQADVAIPLLNERGLVATFFVQPGSECYQQRREIWEVTCPRYGHELANHTWSAKDVRDMGEAEREIGDTSRLIWRVHPHRSRLTPFVLGGSSTWTLSRTQLQQLTTKYCLFSRPDRASIRDDTGTSAQITSYPQRALDEHTWFPVHFHGIGGEWLSTSKTAFIALLDFLVAHRDQLWVATTGAVYRYSQEYAAVAQVSLTDPSATGFSVTLTCDEARVNTYGRPFTELYDEPLTVRVAVPESWSSFVTRQGAYVVAHRALAVDGHRVAQFEVRPNLASVAVTKD